MRTVAGFAICCLLIAQAAASKGAKGGNSDRDQWLKRRSEFFQNTTFELSDEQVRLLGGKFAPEPKTSWTQTHLPFWFDFELFKWVFKKRYGSEDEELRRHEAFVRSCVRALKRRVLFRCLAATRDATIASDADALHDELLAGDTAESRPSGGAIRFAVEFGLEPADGRRSAATSASTSTSAALASEASSRSRERPLEKALRLVRAELAKVASKNQLTHYLLEFNESDGSALAGELPY